MTVVNNKYLSSNEEVMFDLPLVEVFLWNRREGKSEEDALYIWIRGRRKPFTLVEPDDISSFLQAYKHYLGLPSSSTPFRSEF